MSKNAIMWPAIILLLLCAGLNAVNYTVLGVIAGVIGLILIVYALATGKVKTFD